MNGTYLVKVNVFNKSFGSFRTGNGSLELAVDDDVVGVDGGCGNGGRRQPTHKNTVGKLTFDLKLARSRNT